MKSKNHHSLLWRTAGLAAIAGARTMTAPALTSHYLKKRPSRALKRSRFALMQSPRTATVFTVLAAGEMIGDKQPSAPDRISPSALVGRTLSGMLVGATLFTHHRDNPWRGAILGGLSSLVGAYATFYLRKQLSENSRLPDPIWGGLEDIALVKAGQRLLS